MRSRYHRILLVFVDGVGLAPASQHNPLSLCAAPTLRDLLGGPLTLDQQQIDDEVVLLGLDASLGVQGLPQSATGQTALFTGVNAAMRLGRHITGLPGPRLSAIVQERNLFKSSRASGLPTTFANAYTPSYLEALRQGRRRASVTTCAILAAGLDPRSLEDLRAGWAVSWDITRDHFRRATGEELPAVSPAAAGKHLAQLASQHRLTVFESFITDLAGHRRFGLTAADAIKRVDGLLAGLVENRTPETTMVVTSDHGNLEDDRHSRHTANLVPFLAVGPLAREFVGMGSLLDVTPQIVRHLESSAAPNGHPGAVSGVKFARGSSPRRGEPR